MIAYLAPSAYAALLREHGRHADADLVDAQAVPGDIIVVEDNVARFVQVDDDGNLHEYEPEAEVQA